MDIEYEKNVLLDVIDAAIDEIVAEASIEEKRYSPDDEEAIIIRAGEIARLDDLKASIKEVAARLCEIISDIDTMKDARRKDIAALMDVCNLQSVSGEGITVTMKAVPPSVIINDEKAIPDEFMVEREPTLDKRSILKALKDGNEVPGAMLSNGGMTVSIRRK